MLNQDIKRRDELLFGKYDPTNYDKGVARFECLHIRNLQKLIDEGFVDVESKHNESPTIKEFLEFALPYRKTHYFFCGYAFDLTRSDYGIDIDTIYASGGINDWKEEIAFSVFTSSADDLDDVLDFARWD